jgi:hypothetical protein
MLFHSKFHQPRRWIHVQTIDSHLVTFIPCNYVSIICYVKLDFQNLNFNFFKFFKTSNFCADIISWSDLMSWDHIYCSNHTFYTNFNINLIEEPLYLLSFLLNLILPHLLEHPHSIQTNNMFPPGLAFKSMNRVLYKFSRHFYRLVHSYLFSYQFPKRLVDVYCSQQ